MEEWREIPGYEGIYEASTQGRIRTCENKVTSNARYNVRHWKQRIIKQHYSKSKQKNRIRLDARCTLWKDGKPFSYLVARLIARTWCDGYSENMTVNHIDGNTLNNTPQNLEWVNRYDNNNHAFDNGLIGTNKSISIVVNGEQMTFRSYSRASQYIGKSSGYIWNLVHSGRDVSKMQFTV